MVVLALKGQISEGGIPPSLKFASNEKSVQVVPVFQLESLDRNKLLAEDEESGISNRYGIVREVSIDIKDGLKSESDNGTIWRYQIHADQATSIKLFFSEFVVPDGAQLFVYHPDYSLIYGAFTSINNKPDSVLAITDFPENTLVVEYYEPVGAGFSGELHLGQIALGYRDPNELVIGEGLSDYIDVNCEDGHDWQLAKHAVCLYSFTSGGSSYICSGALINNIKSDGTPYFLTANHCISSSTVARTVTAWFNYETRGCGLTKKATQTLSGATLMTTGSNSDFTLLKFDEVPPAAYQPYYAGWDLTDSASSTVGIHHPEGLLKMISIGQSAPETYKSSIRWNEGGTSPASTHWLVEFDKGATAGGSSGSPLFNQNGLVIGQLHGGGDYDSYYGKFNYSWSHSNTSRPGSSYTNLSEYLSPGTALSSMNGYAPESNLPEAKFSFDGNYVCTGSSIQFQDYSQFYVTKWSWEFSPSTVTFLNNTTKNSPNPLVRFDENGTYSVKLLVENGAGRDSLEYPNSIFTGSEIRVTYESTLSEVSCIRNFESVELTARGASAYRWELDASDQPYFNINADAKQASIGWSSQTPMVDSTLFLKGLIIGSQATCVDTAYFSFQLFLPDNDRIENARLITPGTNGPFSNYCATIETNEPVPPVKTCTSQSDWCDEYGNGLNIVEHSVWFCFYGPSTGAVSIEANDMDGQIALYEAQSYQQIFSGSYQILAANDDISDNNPYSKIKTVNVTPGKLYWLQFDGSGGGTEGTFTLVLTPENRSAVEEIVVLPDQQLTLYPQPATHRLNVVCPQFNDGSQVEVGIYTLSGNLLFRQTEVLNLNTFAIDLDQGWGQGVYLIEIVGESSACSGRFILRSE